MGFSDEQLQQISVLAQIMAVDPGVSSPIRSDMHELAAEARRQADARKSNRARTN